jgi:hypothetical protein
MTSEILHRICIEQGYVSLKRLCQALNIPYDTMHSRLRRGTYEFSPEETKAIYNVLKTLADDIYAMNAGDHDKL